MLRPLTIALLLPLALPGLAQRPRIEGRVLKPDGTPLEGARVSIATASVRQGTSPY